MKFSNFSWIYIKKKIEHRKHKFVHHFSTRKWHMTKCPKSILVTRPVYSSESISWLLMTWRQERQDICSHVVSSRGTDLFLWHHQEGWCFKDSFPPIFCFCLLFGCWSLWMKSLAFVKKLPVYCLGNGFLYPLLQWSWMGAILVSHRPSICLSICVQNRCFRSVTSTVLAISYLHI